MEPCSEKICGAYQHYHILKARWPCSVQFLAAIKTENASRADKDILFKKVWHTCGSPLSVATPVRPNMFEHSLTRPCGVSHHDAAKSQCTCTG